MKIFKGMLKSLAALLLVFLIFWAALLGLLQTKSGQNWALNNLKDYVERNGNIHFDVGKVQLLFPLNLVLTDIELFDEANYPIAAIRHLEISCDYAKLLNGRIVFSKFYASDIDIMQLTPKPNNVQNTGEAWDTPPLPLYIKFANIDLQNIHFHEGALPQEGNEEMKHFLLASSFNLQGMISNNPFRKSIAAHLQLKTESSDPRIPSLHLGLDAQNHLLSLSLHLRQFPLRFSQKNDLQNMMGTLSLSASGRIVDWQYLSQGLELRDNSIEGHFKLSLDSQNAEPSVISHLLGNQTIVQGQYLLKGNGEVELISMDAENPFLNIEGNALVNIKEEIFNTSLKGHIKSLECLNQVFNQDLGGSLSYAVQMEGPFFSPQISMKLESPRLSIMHQNIRNVHALIQTEQNQELIKSSLDLSFDHHKSPWRLTTGIEWNSQTLAFSDLLLEGKNASIKGSATWFLPDHIWEGDLFAEADKLEEFSRVLPGSIKGKGKLSLKLSRTLDEHRQEQQRIVGSCFGSHLFWKEWQTDQLNLQFSIDSWNQREESLQVHTELDVKGINIEGGQVAHGLFTGEHLFNYATSSLDRIEGNWKAEKIRLADGGKIDDAEGKITLKHPFEDTNGSLQFSLRNVRTPSLVFSELSGSTDLLPAGAPQTFRLDGRGIWKEEMRFSSEGLWSQNNGNLKCALHHLMGSLGPYPFQLLQPMYFQRLINGIELSGLHLQFGEAELQADFNQRNQKISAQFTTNAVPSELFYFIAPDLPLTGRATLEGKLEGSVSEPIGRFVVDLHDVQIVEDIFAQKPFITGKVMMDLDSRGIHLASELHGIGHTPLVVSGSLPLTLSVDPFKFNSSSAIPFNLLVRAEGEFDPYLQLLFHESTNLSGHAKIAFTLKGQLESPQINGTIDLTNGSYESSNTGAIYHNIHAHLEGDGSKILLTNFSAQDDKDGSLTATGVINLDPVKEFPFEFKINPSRIYILDSDYAEISASGALNLIGNAKKSKLQGELMIEQATIRLEEALPKKIKSVDIKYINLPEEEQNTLLAQNKESSSTIDLDVKLVTKENVSINGGHLQSEWKGSIAVNGTPDHFQLHGDLRVAKGEYDFNGKIFNLTQGTIHFAGAPDKKTTLYVVANKDIDRISADIIVKGPANKPEISFRSTPPLSQREVLSYILFNRGISDITPDQGEQLSQSFISLNAEQTKGGDDFLTHLRKNIGIDHLDITANDKENKDFGLQVGKSITKNVIVSIKQNMTSLSPIIAVEAKLKKDFKLQAEAGVVEDAPVKTSLKWKKDY